MELPDVLNILVATSVTEAQLAKMAAVAPGRVNLIDVFTDIVPLMATQWPPRATERYLTDLPPPQRTPEETQRLLRSAHALVLGHPYPMHLETQPQDLLWIHTIRAGLTHLPESDWYGFPNFSTSRGYSSPLPVAEMAFGALFMFSKRLDMGVRNTLAGSISRETPQVRLVQGKTIGIIGLGGVGAHLARLAKGAGLRVIATRRSATEHVNNVDGVDELFPTSQLHALLGKCDFVVLAVNLTAETENIMDAAALTAMKRGAFLLNIARGDCLDEAALIEALASGHLAGAYLDTWHEEAVRPPTAELLSAPNIVITPHISNRTDVAFGDDGVDLFCSNLRRLLDGEPLVNVIDWQRGY